MSDQYERLERLLGAEPLARLRRARVAVFGLGGVGGSAVEALARSGIGTLDLIDSDRVSPSNLNRQLLATRSTVGQYKVDAAEARIRDIDPDIIVRKYPVFYLPEREGAGGSPDSSASGSLPDFSAWDYIIDAIDTVTGKLGIIQEAQRSGVPVLSCMGCGNRLDPGELTVCDIYETKTDPLARIMRRELRKRGIDALRVVCSFEPAIRPLPAEGAAPGPRRRDVPGSSAFVPPAAGLLAASVVVRELSGFDPGSRTERR
ncbi:tRNA threonylcarbamoyladenosine dehydratase [Lachnoclostridium sp. Marseille-P6806]|uniref:tRNA threonylcarbamoyladenosine dehydratase n=1 Tax=Lachnoclostridium sp. Marseille-P6806 TaxID=2364793 RepID=UPI00102F3889|nr:tRNA threonylcarbamoyladenosine dehydratase [Lachnoclostridium sp. Marseille-P6806]